MKIISFNCNGIRSVLTKEKDGTKHKEVIDNNVITSLLDEEKPDILCLQEIRCGNSLDISKLLKLSSRGYHIINQNCSIVKAGYSGTLVISKHPAITVVKNFPNLPENNELNGEGRIITVEFQKFILINVYVPNSKPDLSRLQFRVEHWEKEIRNHINNLQAQFDKPVIMCGDLNVAPKEIDLHNPKGSKGKHGFTIEERDAFQKLLDECKMVDAYRFLYPTKQNEYTWWSNFAKSREKNKGWRIDIYVVSKSLTKKIEEVKIYNDRYGSDHAPILLSISL
jgi:exodeoxyribonuclease III